MVRLWLTALAGLCGVLVMLAFGSAQGVRAQPLGGSGPFVNFSPIYAGHNNGDALGAVGSRAKVVVSSLNAAPSWHTASSHTVDLYLVNINSENPAGCVGSHYVQIGSTPLVTSSGGSLTFDFVWPTTLTKSAGPVYALCLHEEVTPAAQDYTSATPATAAGNPGTFTVTTDAPAALAVAPGSAHVGDTITVTGKNWSPSYTDSADAAISVSIGTCNSGNVLGSQANVRPDSSGNFSVHFTIPASATAATYQACAASAGGAQLVDATSSVHPPTFQVVAITPTDTPIPPTDVPTATLVPPTATVPVATATTSVGTTTTSPGSSSSSGDNGVLIALLIALIAALVLAGALIFYFVSRRNQPPSPPASPPPPPPGDNDIWTALPDFPAAPDHGWNTLPNTPQTSPWTPQPPAPPAPDEQQQPPIIWG